MSERRRRNALRIRHGLRRLPVLALAAACAWAIAVAPAVADHGVLEVEVTEVVLSEGGELLALVTVLDHERPVPGLTAAEFSAQEDGVEAPILDVEPSTAASIPLSVVVTLDTSGSMEGAAMTASLGAAGDFVRNLADGDPAALVSFADEAVVHHAFATDRDQLIATLGSLEAVGNTALYEAVARSAELAGTATTARKAVLLLSDGEDFGERSTFTREESLAAAEASGAVFYVIGVGQEIDTAYLNELANRSGGRYFAAPGPGDLPGIYQSLSERLRAQYVVTIESPRPGEAGDHDVTVSVETAGASGEGNATYSRAAEPTPAATATHSPVPATSTPTDVAVAGGSTSDDGEAGGGDEGGGGLPIASVGVVVVLLGGLAGAVILRRRSRAGEEPRPVVANADEVPTKHDEARDLPIQGELRVERAGDFVRAVALQARPLTVGSSARSDVVLDGDGVASTQFRLWWRDGRLMLHHVDRGSQTLVNGQPAEWVALDPGDEIAAGEYRLLYIPRENGSSDAGATPNPGG